MARAKLTDDSNDTQEIKTKDFTGAVRTYRQDIKQAVSKVGDYSQELSTAYKYIKKNCGISAKAAKLAFSLDDMEDFKRDDFLRSLHGLLHELNIFMPTDMVDVANGATARASVVPQGERERPKLVTVAEDDFNAADPALQAAE